MFISAAIKLLHRTLPFLGLQLWVAWYISRQGCGLSRAGLQVGCPMRCSFCATGKGGFARNLKAHEIMDQVMTVQEEFGSRVSNIGKGQHQHTWLPVVNLT